MQNGLGNCIGIGRGGGRFFSGSQGLTSHGQLARFAVPNMNSQLLSGPWVQSCGSCASWRCNCHCFILGYTWLYWLLLWFIGFTTEMLLTASLLWQLVQHPEMLGECKEEASGSLPDWSHATLIFSCGSWSFLPDGCFKSVFNVY